MDNIVDHKTSYTKLDDILLKLSPKVELVEESQVRLDKKQQGSQHQYDKTMKIFIKLPSVRKKQAPNLEHS
eukprot:12895712-Ditylum_brightwellii.AAC.1